MVSIILNMTQKIKKIGGAMRKNTPTRKEFKNFAKMIKKNGRLNQQAKKRAINAFKKRYKAKLK